MTEKKKVKISPLIWLVGFPIVSFIINIFLSNGIRALINPDWINPDWIIVISWIELLVIGGLSIVSILCIVYLLIIVLKHISVEVLEKEFYRITKDD